MKDIIHDVLESTNEPRNNFLGSSCKVKMVNYKGKTSGSSIHILDLAIEESLLSR